MSAELIDIEESVAGGALLWHLIFRGVLLEISGKLRFGRTNRGSEFFRFDGGVLNLDLFVAAAKFLFDFGPDFDKGILSVLPPKLVGTPYPVFVPKTDADGNDIAGIRMPEVTVPIATYTGWALRADSLDGCDAAGQQIAFAKTKAERLAAGDPRPSLEERYADHAAYVSLVTRAAQDLKAQRLLLDEDVAATIAAAQAASVP